MQHGNNMSIGNQRQAMAQSDDHQGVVFEDHIPIKERVKEQMRFKSSGAPKTNMVTASVLSTSTARQTTEELLELLSSPQGRKFVRTMAGSVIDGYLEAATSDRFLEANQIAGQHVTTGVAMAMKEAVEHISPVHADVLRRYSSAATAMLAVPLTVVMLALLRFIFFGLDPIFGGR